MLRTTDKILFILSQASGTSRAYLDRFVRCPVCREDP